MGNWTPWVIYCRKVKSEILGTAPALCQHNWLPCPSSENQGVQDRVGGRHKQEGGAGTCKVLQVLSSEELKQPEES